MNLRYAFFTLSMGACAAALAQPAPTPAIDLQVGSARYQAKGQGQCKSAQGGIYGIAATQYNITHRDGSRSLNATLWQPKDGSGDMLQLQVSEGSRRVEVDTVKGGTKQATRGSSKTSLRRTGGGAVLEIDAVAAGGEKITGRIECPGFAAIRAEGG